MEQLSIDVNDLVAAYEQRVAALTKDSIMQQALIAGLRGKNAALADEVAKLKSAPDVAP
jgi:hypothetical protein